MGSLEVFRGALGVPNYFVASLCAGNCISTTKLLAISKTAQFEIMFVFLEHIRVVWGCSAVL